MGEAPSETETEEQTEGDSLRASYLFFLFNASDQGIEIASSKRPSHENSMGPLQRLSYKGSSYPGTIHR